VLFLFTADASLMHRYNFLQQRLSALLEDIDLDTRQRMFF